MRSKKLAPFVVLLLLLLLALILRRGCNPGGRTVGWNKRQSTRSPRSERQDGNSRSSRGLNRNPAHLNYSKHAQCRMDCRHITQNEIRELLQHGTINYRKSELQAADCRKKYAVEGYSNDRQHIRVIFAPCADEVTVVTCIDLDQEWECDCR